MESIDVSIVIVNHNAKNFLNDCLISIFDTVMRTSYEITVIDNHSSDDSAKFLKKKFPKVKLIANKDNFGYARANNQGIKIARGDFILLLNPDTVVQNESIQKMVEYARKNTDVGIVGCRVINPGDKLQWDSCGTVLVPLTLFLKESGLEKLYRYIHFFDRRLMRYWQRDSSRPIDWVSGVCMLIKKKVIEDIGMLDERFFSYMEDMDFCRRARQEKWQIYFLSNAEIFHNLSASWKQRSEKHLFTSLTSEKKYFDKHYKQLGVVLFKIFHLCGSYLRLFINTVINNRKKAKNHFRILRWLLTNEI